MDSQGNLVPIICPARMPGTAESIQNRLGPETSHLRGLLILLLFRGTSGLGRPVLFFLRLSHEDRGQNRM